MKKQILAKLALVGITGIGSAIAAIIVNGMNRKQLDKIEIKEEVKQEVREEINNIEEENNESEHKDEQLNIDDSDIDV